MLQKPSSKTDVSIAIQDHGAELDTLYLVT